MRVSQWVRHDRLDDEVMVIDLNSGAYFALTGAAADAWSLFAGGCGVSSAAEAMAERFGVDVSAVRDDLAVFLEELRREGLIAESDEGLSAEAEPSALPPVAAGYSAPRIDRFDDLADLLLIDPVHEVEPTGWPSGRND